jgi:uncharacterized protein (TIGR02145 family)
MKKTITLLFAVIIAAISMAQSPQKFSYQAVVRDNGGDLVVTQEISIKVSILDDIEGNTLWTEEQTVNTNENGLLSIEIGAVIPLPYEIFQQSPLFIKTEIDIDGGFDYTITGTSQLLSVPYAIHAKSAEIVIGELPETDPVFSAWNKDYDDLTNKPTAISDFILDANDNNITNVANPLNDKDAVNKEYIDNVVAGLLNQMQDLQNQLNCLPIFDSRDGNYYQTVIIGNQCWMAENLKYLPSVADLGTSSDTNPYYYVYDYDDTDVEEAKATDNYKIYGVLYNWSAANIACPEGWHLPSDDDFKELEMALGMSQADADSEGLRGTNEGSKIAGAYDLWQDGDLRNNIEFGTSGFSAIPAGVYYYQDPSFLGLGTMPAFWSSTASSLSRWSRVLTHDNSSISRSSDETSNGFSVRCIKE